jgi:hypothetical protein
MIYLVASMQKAGSIWVVAMINDLVVKLGGSYFGDVRKQFRMGWFVRQSGLMPSIHPLAGLHLLLTQAAGQIYALQTYSKPNLTVKTFMKMGFFKPVYLFRDPREVARSMFDHGRRIREGKIHSDTAWDQLETMEESIRYTATFMDTWRQWTTMPNVLTATYEKLRQDTVSEMVKLCEHLELSATPEMVEKVVARYQPSSTVETDTHPDKAGAGSWKAVMTPEQVDLCHQLFGSTIKEMGYEL